MGGQENIWDKEQFLCGAATYVTMHIVK